RTPAVPPRVGSEFMQDFEPLSVQLRGTNAPPRRIAARPRQAGREAAAHHVITHRDDRDGRRRALRRANGGVAECDNEIDVLPDKFASQRGRSLVLALGPNEQETNITSIFPANYPHVT